MKKGILGLLALFLALGTACHTAVTPETPGPAEQGSTSEEPETPPEPIDRQAAEAALAAMTREEKAWQLLIVRPEALTEDGTAVTEADQLTRAWPVGGFMLSTGNLTGVEQVQALTAGLAAKNAAVPALLTVDEEGGRVARVGNTLGIVQLEDMYTYREEGPQTAFDNAAALGSMLRDLGFTLDFAPVADVWTNPENTVIGTRAYSSDPEQAAELVGQAVRGFASTGMGTCLKHFPGHGDTREDSHQGAAATDRTQDEWRKCEALPFAAGIEAGADMVMVGHITMTAVDAEHPATLSPAVVTGLLREELGFTGVVITDGMEMGAIVDYYGDEAAALAILAGCDLVLLPQDAAAAVQSILEQVDEERLDESVYRVLYLKARLGLLALSEEPGQGTLQ